jgi:carotenoid 1,2-hydratase
MLTLTAPDRILDRARLAHAPGGFAWWYADLLDEERNGLVLIWSFGLPFLPGYLGSVRAGRPQRPIDRPSLNLVLYERGEPSFYALQEHDPADAEWSSDGTRFRFGRSILESRTEGGRRVLHAELDQPIPGSDARLRGTLDIDGPARVLAGAEPREVDARFHDWTPLTAVAWGEAELKVGRREVRLSGRAYHDRNGSRTPFDRLGIAEWVWGRAALPDRELIWYLLWPARGDRAATFVGAEIGADGRTRLLDSLKVRAEGERRARFGLRYWERLELSDGEKPWLTVESEPPVDDGPFYLRSFVRATAPGGQPALGTGEVCVPSRVDRPLERPFVRMRVERVGGPSSRWLPLFAGPREDRLWRLARTLRGRSR